MAISALVQRFVLHFGEMGSRWGINRTVGQIYALLIANPQSLNADEIAEALDISRSNVSMSLKELQSWQLVRLEHRVGDRRDYFRAPDDAWQIFKTLAEERKKREIDPTISMLKEATQTPCSDGDDRYAQMRMKQMLELFSLMVNWYDDIQHIDQQTLLKLMKLGNKIQKLL